MNSLNVLREKQTLADRINGWILEKNKTKHLLYTQWLNGGTVCLDTRCENCLVHTRRENCLMHACMLHLLPFPLSPFNLRKIQISAAAQG